MVSLPRVLAAWAAGVLFAATLAESHHFLFGMETTTYQLPLDQTGGAVVPGSDYKALHSTSAVAAEWSYKHNFRARLCLGTVASTLEEIDASSDGAEGLWYCSLAAGVETRLESGGGLLLDLSYSFGALDSEETACDMEYNHDRTSFIAAYTFGEPDKARFYTGLAYNTYKLETRLDESLQLRFQEDQRFSFVCGVRARSETFAGVIEATLGGELGLRVGVMFGF